MIENVESAHRSAHFKRNARRHRGFTLVEVTIVVSLTSIVLGGVAVLLQGMWRAERSVAGHRANMAAMFRVGELFRDDVHAGRLAESAVPPSGGSVQRLTLTLPGDRTVEYSGEDARIRRVIRKNGEAVHEDTFVLAAESTVGWQIAGDGQKRVTLLITSPLGVGPADLADKRTIRIDAAMGSGTPSIASAP